MVKQLVQEEPMGASIGVNHGPHRIWIFKLQNSFVLIQDTTPICWVLSFILRVFPYNIVAVVNQFYDTK
jgi:hypothetical protein